MIELIFSIIIFLIIHISTMALFLRLSGVSIVEISYGVGPTILRKGKVSAHLVPISGYVKALDSRDDELSEEERRHALNHQSAFVQAFLPLSGCIVVLLFSFAIIGVDGLSLFVSAFKEVVVGALHPLSFGQEYINRTLGYFQEKSLVSIIAAVHIKLAALNLLPLTTLNGGQALVAVFKHGKPAAKWELPATIISLILAFVLMTSWSVAVLYYVWQHI
jgi:membrane-associated protease RseP (regulator of RpoE activity)